MRKNIKISVLGLIIIVFFICIKGLNVLAETNNYVDKVPIFSVDTNEKKIALTFDMNWADDDKLDEILEVLEKNNVKSTFFLIGKWVNYPSDNTHKVRKIDSLGHEIANHSYEHSNFLKINGKQIENDLGKANKIIYDITGKTNKIFRFPSGYYSSEAVKIINELGYTSVQWSKDSLDWMNKNAESEYQRVMKDIKSGDIVLFHNNGKFTPSNLERIIPELQKQGYELVTVSEILHNEKFFVDELGRQFKIS